MLVTLRPSATPPATQRLWVVLRLDEMGPEVTREPVTDADLADAHSELWLGSCLRRGLPDVPLEALSFRTVPLFKADGSPLCSGFALETANPKHQTTRYEFTISALDHVADRIADRLLETGLMKLGDPYYFEIVADGRPLPPAPAGNDPEIKITSKKPPLSYLTVPLPPLLQQCRTVGSTDDRCYPVFFTEAALARAESVARRGGRSQPPTETGGIFIGTLCSCPQTGEFFVVVGEVLEVTEAQEAPFSLTYSSKSWARIQTVMKARQANPATRAQRIVGQCHGHNFLPANGAPPCELCHKVKVCTRTSVFVSADDCLWSRAVFSQQPWQLCQIYGLNARNEPVDSLYGLRDGQLIERGFHVIPAFHS